MQGAAKRGLANYGGLAFGSVRRSVPMASAVLFTSPTSLPTTQWKVSTRGVSFTVHPSSHTSTPIPQDTTSNSSFVCCTVPMSTSSVVTIAGQTHSILSLICADGEDDDDGM
eukprot:TRINITY_DN1443_c0_g1_i1.p1 TRINITY_DN1443_c0_g1~~TRINITY_DN1443_c0_g1_i1.p1  ORF type:complete len:112 (-),score=16.54 TRINITY_DN1443_c0_g1_i1:113-448(-)